MHPYFHPSCSAFWHFSLLVSGWFTLEWWHGHGQVAVSVCVCVCVCVCACVRERIYVLFCTHFQGYCFFFTYTLWCIVDDCLAVYQVPQSRGSLIPSLSWPTDRDSIIVWVTLWSHPSSLCSFCRCFRPRQRCSNSKIMTSRLKNPTENVFLLSYFEGK